MRKPTSSLSNGQTGDEGQAPQSELVHNYLFDFCHEIHGIFYAYVPAFLSTTVPDVAPPPLKTVE